MTTFFGRPRPRLGPSVGFGVGASGFLRGRPRFRFSPVFGVASYSKQVVSDSRVDSSGLGTREPGDHDLENAITSGTTSLGPGTRVEPRDRLDGVSMASVVSAAPLDLRLGALLSSEIGRVENDDSETSAQTQLTLYKVDSLKSGGRSYTRPECSLSNTSEAMFWLHEARDGPPVGPTGTHVIKPDRRILAAKLQCSGACHVQSGV